MRKKILTIILSLAVAFTFTAMGTAVVSASEETDTFKAVNSTGEEQPVKASSPRFITEFAVAAGENSWRDSIAQNKLTNEGYTVVKGIYGDGQEHYFDLNRDAGGHYIYLGYKTTDDFIANKDKLITGLLVYKNTSNNHPAHLEWEGKTYYPVTKAIYDSNLNLNQGRVEGLSLFLYYTNDRVDKGDPVLTDDIWVDSFGSRKSSDNYVRGISIGSDGIASVNNNQDLNESVEGKFLYLKTNYHHHELTNVYDPKGTYKKCKVCGFRTSSKPISSDQFESANVELLSAKTSGDKAVKLSWNKIDGATEYVVYGQKCGKKYKKLTTTDKTSYTVKKIAGKKLKAHKAYKFYVKAVTANGTVKSKSVHFITGNTNGKYANAKSISVNKKSLTLDVGETAKLKVTTKIYKNKKHLSKNHGDATRYISDNPGVATVNSKGVVTAKSAGTANIYIQDIGGKYCKVSVTVKDNEKSIGKVL